MSRRIQRGSIPLAALAVALLMTASAQAQQKPKYYGPPPPTEGLGNALTNGYAYEIANQAKAERRVGYVQAKLQRDSERGNAAAVSRDARTIDRLRYRIAVDQWLIRKGKLCDLGYYPIRNDANCLP